MFKKIILFSLLGFIPLFAAPVEDGTYQVTMTHLEFDPYEGTHIDSYLIFLQNETEWVFDWSIYEKNHLNIQVGDCVEIKHLSNTDYVMFIPQEEGTTKAIGFTDSGTLFYAHGSL